MKGWPWPCFFFFCVGIHVAKFLLPFIQVIEISTSLEDSNGVQRPRRHGWNPFAQRPSNPSPKRRRFSVLSHLGCALDPLGCATETENLYIGGIF